MAHFVEICEFGRRHGTCRCISKDKEVRKVKCTTPKYHGPFTLNTNKDVAESLHARMSLTVARVLVTTSQHTLDELVDQLEQDVKNWLLDRAKFLAGEGNG